MKFLLKLIILGVAIFFLYYFFGPQIENFIHRGKGTINEVMKGQQSEQAADKPSQSDHEPKYYPLDKRTE